MAKNSEQLIPIGYGPAPDTLSIVFDGHRIKVAADLSDVDELDRLIAGLQATRELLKPKRRRSTGTASTGAADPLKAAD